MSRIIKASQITGEYRLEENSYIKMRDILEKKNNQDHEQEQELSQNKYKVRKKESRNGIIAEAEIRAASIIEEAEEIAKSMKDQARDKLQNARQEGYQQGYQDGLENGREAGREEVVRELNGIMESFDNIIKETKAEVEKDIDNLQQDMIELALDIAGRVVTTVVEINPELINDIVIDMIKQMSDIEELNIHINSQMLQYISEYEFETDYGNHKINFIGESSLESADCIVETKFGGKDGTIENKLKLLKKELLKGAGFNEKD